MSSFSETLRGAAVGSENTTPLRVSVERGTETFVSPSSKDEVALRDEGLLNLPSTTKEGSSSTSPSWCCCTFFLSASRASRRSVEALAFGLTMELPPPPPPPPPPCVFCLEGGDGEDEEGEEALLITGLVELPAFAFETLLRRADGAVVVVVRSDLPIGE